MDAIDLRPGRPAAHRSEQRLVQLAFILLFPGFFFYQTLLGLGITGAFLGGYFTRVALVLAVPLIYFYAINARRRPQFISEFDRACAMLIVYLLLVLLANFVAGADTMILQRYLQGLVFCIELYIIFRLIDLKDKKFLLMATVSLLAMSAITIHFSIDGFFYLHALNAAKDPDSLATYQGFARSYLYTFLIVVSISSSVGARFLLYALAITTLFLNGARSEFSAVLFLVPLLEFYHSRRKLFVVPPVLVLMVVLAANAGTIAAMLPQNRTLQLLDLSHSTSGVARQHLSRDAWRTITQNPAFGDFASYPDGHYAHNLLAAWVDFGLAGFLAFAAILGWAAFRLFTNGFFLKKRSSEFVLAWSFICITILWAATAKNVPDMSIGAAIGAFAQYRYGKRAA